MYLIIVNLYNLRPMYAKTKKKYKRRKGTYINLKLLHSYLNNQIKHLHVV